MHPPWAVPCIALLGLGLAGCGSSSSVDASCDVDGVNEEIAHIVSESGATIGAVESMRCEEGWAYATVTVVEPAGEASQVFLLRGTDLGWILTSPADSCVAESPIALPDALREDVCVSNAGAAPSS